MKTFLADANSLLAIYIVFFVVVAVLLHMNIIIIIATCMKMRERIYHYAR